MDIGIERMASYEEELLKKAEEVLAAIPQVNILGHPKQRAGCISIQIDGVHPYDFASMIDKYGVAVRTGSMCAQPIVNKNGIRHSDSYFSGILQYDGRNGKTWRIHRKSNCFF